MPAAGTTKIPKAKKAQIVAEKRLKIVKPEVQAKKLGVSVGTIYNIGVTKDPEVLAIADKIEQRIISKAQLNVEKVLDAIGERVVDRKEPLAAIVSAGKFSHDVYRLETNQPTSINQNQKSPLELAIEFAKILLSKHPDPSEAKMLFGYANTARVGIGASEEEWKQVEAQVFG